MRLNRFLALATGLSRRAADAAITANRVTINDQPAKLGDDVSETDIVKLDQQIFTPSVKPITIMLNKPPGYVCSRAGQGSRTIYDLLPAEYHSLKPVGRLDKDSSGLLLLTDDGDLTNRLTHPRYAKAKLYEVTLDKPLATIDRTAIGQGVELDDGASRLQLEPLGSNRWQVTMSEGRNRQIRRTFAALGYVVIKLHRSRFGPYSLDDLPAGKFQPQ